MEKRLLSSSTDVRSHRNRPEQNRVLPVIDTFNKYNIQFKDINQSHIANAIEELRGGLANAQGDRNSAGRMEFILKHSKTMAMYTQALKEMKDFETLRCSGKGELASDKWKQWVQRSQTHFRDGDVATLVTNAIGQQILMERLRDGQKIFNITQELPYGEVDISKIHPPAYFLALHGSRAWQHWGRMIQVHYGGEFEGYRGNEAINKFYEKLDAHTQSLMQNAFAFRGVKPQGLWFILNNRGEKLPGTMPQDIKRISLNQAMFGSSASPTHAYMSDNQDGTLPEKTRVGRYDRLITCRLKKDRIRPRATLAFDDLIYHYWRKENELTIVTKPMDKADRDVWPLTQPLRVIMKNRRVKPREAYNIDLRQAEHFQNQNPLAVRSINDLDNYATLLIHGGLELDDVEKVFLRQELLSRFLKPEEIQRVPTLLAECNIEWEYLNE